MPFRSTHPATGEALSEHAALSPADVIAATGRAGAAFPDWAGTAVERRCEPLVRWAQSIRDRHEELARLASLEMGKPVVQSRQELDRCVAGLEYVAAHAPAWLAEERREVSGAAMAFVRHEPMGVLLAVMPWNFPYWQIVRFACGALAAGNTVLIKPAPNTAGCALALEACAREAGLAEGVYTTLLAEVSDLEAVIAQDAVAAVSLTGSVRAGRALAMLGAKYGKPAVLELGGSDPFVVLDDADVTAAARAAAAARLMNSGQSCVCAKRFIVTPDAYAAFREAVVAEFRRHRLGDPLYDTTDVGPLARADLRDTLADQLARAARGATPLLGGGPLADRPGCFFAPEILELAAPAGPVWTEETFGPLAALVRAESEAHAVTLANATPFGLGASIWSRDVSRARTIAGRITAGFVSINAPVRPHPALPFGGTKASGHGRELGSEGVRQFTHTKALWIAEQQK